MADRVPKESRGDDAHLAARMALSAIPVVGGPAVELFNRLLAPPIQRRRDAWLNELAERVFKLEQEGRVKVEDLQNKDEFVSAVMQASQVAVRCHQREKLDALRNAVLNVAIGPSLDDTKREMFLGLIDEFGVWHLRILSLVADPVKWFKRHNKPALQFAITSSLSAVFERAFPEMREQGELLDLLAKQLHEHKLIGIGNIMLNMSADAAMTKTTTNLGDEFLRFISEPVEKGGT